MKTHVLIVVDLQNDFVDGALGTPEAIVKLNNIVEKITTFEDPKCIVFLMDSHYDDDYLSTREGKALPIEHCIVGTPGWELPSEVEDFVMGLGDDDSVILTKDQFGAPNVLDTIEVLLDRKAENTGLYISPKDVQVDIIGYRTDVCILFNAVLLRTMLAPEIEVTVHSDCCAGTSKENHDSALEIMKNLGIEVV